MRHVLLLAVLALVALAPPAAGAQDEPHTTVATLGDVVLGVRDAPVRGGAAQLCVRLQTQIGIGTAGCDDVPEGRIDGNVRTAGGAVGGVVPANTTRVEVELRDGRRIEGQTVEGDAYRGAAAGRVRFFLIAVEGTQETQRDDVLLVRRFDAAGALVGAFGDAFPDADGGESFRLLTRRVAGQRVRVAVNGGRIFAPSLVRVDRTTRAVCLTVTSSRGGSGSCSGEALFPPPTFLETHQQCGRIGTVISGLGGDGVGRVVVTLGSGRRVTTRPVQVRETLGRGLRAVALVAPVGEAVRSAALFDGDGRLIRRQPIGAAPGGRPCRSSGHVSGIGGFHDLPSGVPAASTEGQQTVAATPTGARLVVRDDLDDHLCLGIDRLRADRADCHVPSPDERFGGFGLVQRDATGQRTVAGGTIPPEVTRVAVEVDDARLIDAQVTSGPDYRGTYQGVLRFFLAETPGRHRVTAVEYFRADGTRYARLPAQDTGTVQPETFHRSGGIRFFGGRSTFDFQYPGQPDTPPESFRCVGVTLGAQRPDPHACEPPSPFSDLSGFVACGPRLGVLYGRIAKGGRGAELILAGGRVLRPRIVRVPSRFGGGRLWYVRVPREARVVRLRRLGRIAEQRFRPRPKRTVAYPLPAPARQCGYAAPDADG